MALDNLHFVTHRVDDGEVIVDNQVQQLMQHVIDAVGEQLGRRLQLHAQFAVPLIRAMTDGNDMVVRHEKGGFAKDDPSVTHHRRQRDDEQLVAINFQLGQLVRFQRIFHRERMQIEPFRAQAHFRLARLLQAHPVEAVSRHARRRWLIEIDRADPTPVAI